MQGWQLEPCVWDDVEGRGDLGDRHTRSPWSCRPVRGTLLSSSNSGPPERPGGLEPAVVSARNASATSVAALVLADEPGRRGRE